MFAKGTDELIERLAEVYRRDVDSVNIGFDYGGEFLKILMTVVFKEDPNRPKVGYVLVVELVH